MLYDPEDQFNEVTAEIIASFGKKASESGSDHSVMGYTFK